MNFDLLPSVSLRPRSFNALVAPNEMFASALNRNLNLQRFKVLYICGNYSSTLSRLDSRFQDLEIRRAFTVFQLMTILEEARHSLIVIEHDPMLYEDAQGMVEYVSRGLHESQADPRGDLPRQALGCIGDDQMRLERRTGARRAGKVVA